MKSFLVWLAILAVFLWGIGHWMQGSYEHRFDGVSTVATDDREWIATGAEIQFRDLERRDALAAEAAQERRQDHAADLICGRTC